MITSPVRDDPVTLKRLLGTREIRETAIATLVALILPVAFIRILRQGRRHADRTRPGAQGEPQVGGLGSVRIAGISAPRRLRGFVVVCPLQPHGQAGKAHTPSDEGRAAGVTSYVAADSRAE